MLQPSGGGDTITYILGDISEPDGYVILRNGTLDLEIEDELLVENSGRWRLTIEAGSATVRPGGEGKLRMDIRALAPLFSSYYTADQLVRLGVIQSSDDRQLTLAAQAFAGDAPWLPELY